jgi:hypothetical protein
LPIALISCNHEFNKPQIYYDEFILKNCYGYKAFTIRNGNINKAPTNLNTSSIVSPTILKGSRISQKRGSKMSIIRARGQHKTKRIHQRRKAIKDFIRFFIRKKSKSLPFYPNA